ncbi:putative enoyl-CoA hydratase, mitochondrial [Ananas comosus]|uniref:Putative enoyl-CoA hydratase, mitochondrial n=1 Tax=Ananas comosus TaxID=4615 RepID=A0A199UZK7_ANACO|nr:putative enoyl-CoA hydratase, mitochondrial [Ananas comosus]
MYRVIKKVARYRGSLGPSSVPRYGAAYHARQSNMQIIPHPLGTLQIECLLVSTHHSLSAPSSDPTPTSSSSAVDELIVVERRPHGSAVVVVTINRPGALNSLTRPMMVALAGAFRRLDADDTVAALVLTGHSRACCSGVDLTRGDIKEPAADPVAAMVACRKPIVGAIAGFIVTARLEIALACDLLVTGRDAKFADPYAAEAAAPRRPLRPRPRRSSLTPAPEAARSEAARSSPTPAPKAAPAPRRPPPAPCRPLRPRPRLLLADLRLLLADLRPLLADPCARGRACSSPTSACSSPTSARSSPTPAPPKPPAPSPSASSPSPASRAPSPAPAEPSSGSRSVASCPGSPSPTSSSPATRASTATSPASSTPSSAPRRRATRARSTRS